MSDFGPLSFTTEIVQLEARIGGYTVVLVEPAVFEPLPEGRKTRVLCRIGTAPAWHCALLPLGNGSAYIIISRARLKSLHFEVGETVEVWIEPDPSPLGAPMPEVLEALLEQDEAFRQAFESFTPGKKRSLIFGMNRFKNPDKQVTFAYEFWESRQRPSPRH